jgi:elongation factor Ts
MGLCKEALVTKNGDLKLAEQWLREKGVKPDVIARATAEGVLIAKIAPDGKAASLVELKCETDFAAKNERFRKLAHDIADVALHHKASSAHQALSLPLGSGTVDALIKAEIAGVIKENIKFERVEYRSLEGPGRIGSYVHSNGKLAVLVGVKAPNDAAATNPAFETLIKDVAMHIAGASPFPVAIDRKSVAADLVDTERKFVMKQLADDPKESKKPESIREKIADGRMSKFFKEKALLEQAFVKDDSKTVEQIIAEAGKALGGTPVVAWFVRHQLGV